MNKDIKIAIAFYGITRSLKYTIDSIYKNIINPTKEIANVKIFCHFFSQTSIENPRTNESIITDPNEWKLLNPDIYIIDEVDVAKEKIIYENLIKFGNAWEDDGQSLKNIIRQLISLQIISNKIEENDNFDYIIFARPDMIYHDSFSDIIKKQINKQNKICIPYWAWSGGLNDRFAICGKKAYKIYGNRIDQALNYCISKNKPFHSERLLMFAIQKSTSQLNTMPHRATRVRGNGIHADEVFTKVKSAKIIEAFFLCNVIPILNNFFRVKKLK